MSKTKYITTLCQYFVFYFAILTLWKLEIFDVILGSVSIKGTFGVIILSNNQGTSLSMFLCSSNFIYHNIV